MAGQLYGRSIAWSPCVCVITMKSARVMWASMVAVSGSAMSSLANSLRESAGSTSSFGVTCLSRDKYGSMSTTVVPSLISQPAVPRYFS